MIRPFARSLVAPVGAALFALACVTGASGQDDEVVATVNGNAITQSQIAATAEELRSQLARVPAEQRFLATLSHLIDIRLAAAAADADGLDDTEAFARRMELLKERALHAQFVEDKVAGTITEDAVRQRYDEDIASAPPVNEVKASHILIRVEDGASEEQKAAARAEAEAIIAQLNDGGDFAELAREHSADGSAQTGGDLGYFGPGRMVPPFEEAAFALEVGAHSQQPVESQFGFHIIKVEDKRPQQPPAFEDVAGELRTVMFSEKYGEEMQALRDAAQIEYADPALQQALEGGDAPSEEPAE